MKKLFLWLFSLGLTIGLYGQREAIENHYHAIKVADEAIHDVNEALSEPEAGKFQHQQIYWEMSDMLFNRASFKYQYLFNNKAHIAIYIPFSIHFGNHKADVSNNISDYMPLNLNRPDESDYYWGLGLKIYPLGIKYKIDFFIGCEMRFGSFSDKNDYYSFIEEKTTNTNLQDKDYFYSAFVLNPGMQYKVLNHFIVGLELDVGLYLDQYNSLNAISSPSLIIGLSF